LSSVPRPLAAAWAAALGAAVGSFLNVVVARLPRGESLLRPGSRCPRCRTPIAWHDNVPVLSWVLLRARCRACRVRIPARYPLVELLGAGVALAAWARHGLAPAAAVEFAFAALLVALSFIDLDTWTLPNALTWALVALGLGAAALGIGPAPSLASAAAGATVGFLALALVSWGSTALARRSGRIGPDQEAFGFGDVWLFCGLGATLGIGALLPVLLLSSVQGALVGVVLLLAGKAATGEKGKGVEYEDGSVPPRASVPFGPFLALGALEWLWLSGSLAAAFPALDAFR
ncbi:MAG TPA: prepilin peptidase, partial [Anaeromyxobacteraceae bacterium]|nr:prepilin peptidase [Anaeromyxobacteraceae bacterium]